MGVYRINFDSGQFYIGGTAFLKCRVRTWTKILSGEIKTGRYFFKHIEPKVCGCKTATIEFIKEVTHRSYVQPEENKELMLNSANPLLINQFLYTRCGVIQVDKTGNTLARFDSIMAAAKYFDTKVARIRESMTGKRPCWKGKYFKYADELAAKKNKWKEKPKIVTMKVSQFDLNGKFIQNHKTISSAARFAKVDKNGVNRAICGRQRTSAGFIWKLNPD